MFRVVLCTLLIGYCTWAPAQVFRRLQLLLTEDTLALPDHDTAYIATYRSKLVLSAVGRYQYTDIDLTRPEQRTLTYTTEVPEMYGFGVDLRWLSVELTFGVPSSWTPDRNFTSRSRGLGLGYTGRRWWARALRNVNSGYTVEDVQVWGLGPAYLRHDLRMDSWIMTVNHALSRKARFSQNAAIYQMERQKRSTGTWLAGLLVWHNRINADSSLVPHQLVDTFALATGFTAVERGLVGVSIGYTHSFVLGHKGFIHAAFNMGPAYMDQAIRTTDGEQLRGGALGSVGEFKLGAGFNGDRWYAAFTTAYTFASGQVSVNGVGLDTQYGTARVAIGLRFGAPGIAALRTIGL